MFIFRSLSSLYFWDPEEYRQVFLGIPDTGTVPDTGVCQQSIVDNELIVDKVVLINKELYAAEAGRHKHTHKTNLI